MPPRRFAILFALSTAGFAADPAFAAVGLGGSVFQHAEAHLNRDPATVDEHSDSWTGGQGIRDLSASAVAEEFVTAGGALNGALATTNIAGHWDSANRGSVTVSGRGWDIFPVSVGSGSVELNTGTGVFTPDWTYSFSAAGDGMFGLDFDLQGSGDDLQLGIWDLAFAQVAGPGQIVHLSQDFDFDPVHRTGTFTHALAAGQTYTVSLISHGGLTVGRTDEPFVGSEHDQFDWSITDAAAPGVPEPGAWALSIAGTGLASAALRRRRRPMAA
jgi:hypothetical protein